MEKDFDFYQVPNSWPICSLADCPRKAECLRYQAFQCLPEGRTQHPCVLPTVLRLKACPHFHPIQKVRVALGFRNIFNNVLARDIAAMRSELADYLGHGGTYYLYRNGKKPLTPAQQAWINKMFSRYGYKEEMFFDNYKTIYQFSR